MYLVSEVLGEGDAGVDGGLSGSHGHVGRVGHQARTVHDAHLITRHNRKREKEGKYKGETTNPDIVRTDKGALSFGWCGVCLVDVFGVASLYVCG